VTVKLQRNPVAAIVLELIYEIFIIL